MSCNLSTSRYSVHMKVSLFEKWCLERSWSFTCIDNSGGWFAFVPIRRYLNHKNLPNRFWPHWVMAMIGMDRTSTLSKVNVIGWRSILPWQNFGNPKRTTVFACFCYIWVYVGLWHIFNIGSKLGYRWVTTVEVMLVFQASDCYGITWRVKLFLG